MTTHLSPTMTDALSRARAAGALYRWPGGFWTDHPYTDDVHRAAATRGVDAVPAWWVSTQTLSALRARKLVSLFNWNVPRVGGRKLAVVTPTPEAV